MKPPSDLLGQILSGQNRGLQLVAAQGVVPLEREELVALQVALTGSPDAEIADAATASLGALEPRAAAAYLTEHAGPRELAWFAGHSGETVVLEAIVRRRDVPRDVLFRLALTASPDLQEELILRQDAILDEPQILLGLEQNPELTPYVRRRIGEYREHLLPRERPEPARREEVAEGAAEPTDEEVQAALAEAAKRPAAPTEEKVDDLAGLSDGQIRGLPVPIRMRLARGASRQVRNVLIRDSNAQVALSVLNGNQLSEQEVEQIASNRAVVDDVLREILRRKEWVGKYAIAKALIKNPKSGLADVMRLLGRMSLMDLRELSRDRNLADAVRSTAKRMYQAKQK